MLPCGTVVEPLVSKQWFVKMDKLAERAWKVVEEGQIRFIPERFTNSTCTGWKISVIVYFQTAVVGSPHSSLVLWRLWSHLREAGSN